MIINIRDPESVARWLAIWPARHWQQLASMVSRHPDWQAAALEAREIVRAGRVPSVQG